MTLKDCLKRISQEYSYVKETQPETEKMPDHCFMPKFDIEIIKPVFILTEIFKAKTQWSCQGHVDSKWDLAYIRFHEGFKAPESLIKKLEAKGFISGFAQPFVEHPEKKIFIMRAFNADVTNPAEKILRNKEFLHELNLWSDSIISKYIK